ncbi:transglutaminase family protein [Roseomonas alkaliterrae]|uniref:Transglutaminase-like putative cysteine protease n=1 Tax=Neoroseomonas alkaliterrae TaxID=1452450 RepID=A0A840Y3J2_9PROT|nr:transglutaminase-like putative cysteine protease [Neoroseomonas alkaliterrae]MBR0674678.1 transglutaminase family protein [Neoroseomonas alkaliterrae]
MIYRLRHVTTYAYAHPVDLAAHLLLLTPRRLPHQSVARASLRVTPTPSHTTLATDHFGNAAMRVFLDVPHARFEVVAEAVVEVRFPDPPAPAATPAWEDVAAGARAAEAAEFLFGSALAPLVPAAAGYAAASFPARRPVLAGLLELMGRIRRDFTYRPGVTGPHTQVADVLESRTGVCQDYAHVMISGLRGLGIPARYVSGYVRTRPPPGGIARRGSDQSHAWVEAWLGPEHGWVGLDPTNDIVVKDEHVVLAWGRDFADVSPLRGVILGGGEHGLWVGVDLEEAEGPVPA